MKVKLDTVDWNFNAEKTDMQKLNYAQKVLRKRLIKKMKARDEALKEKKLH